MGPSSYFSNQPPPAVLVEYLIEHDMRDIVEYMAAQGHLEARRYLADE